MNIRTFLCGWLFAIPCFLVAQDCSTSNDSLQLIKLYSATNGPSWENTWDLNQPIRNWYGVKLNASGCVERLDLSGNNLEGNTQAFGGMRLPALRMLDLSENELSGYFPSIIAPELDTVWLNNNQLSGGIPNSFSSKKITFLELAYNQFSLISNNLNLPLLEVLDVSNNNLDQSLPDFKNIPQLKVLFLWNNQLRGNIPDFSKLPELEILQLGKNELTGSVPNFTNLPKLKKMDLWVNQLSGRLPYFTNLPALEKIDFSFNNIEHVSNLANLPSLKELVINDNKLSFDDIIQNQTLPLSTYKYTPQKPVGIQDIITLDEGQDYTINLNIDQSTSTGTEFRWTKDDVFFQVNSSPRLEFSNIRLSDEAIYKCRMTNNRVPDLVLESYPIEIRVSESECLNAAFDYLIEDKVVSFASQVYSREGGTSYAWDFGDGGQSSLSDPVHEYLKIGIYDVCLTVTNGCGTQKFCSKVNLVNCDSSELILEWVKKIKGKKLEVDKNENIIVFGNSLIKLKPNGEEVFNIKFGEILKPEVTTTFDGEIIITGISNNEIDFDPSNDKFILNQGSGVYLIFLAKYDQQGNLIFAKNISDVSHLVGEYSNQLFPSFSIKIISDIEENIFISGTFPESIHFFSSEGGKSLKSVGGNDLYLAKFNKSGSLISAYSTGSNGYDAFHGIEIGGNGNLYLMGTIKGDVNFRFNGLPFIIRGEGYLNTPFVAVYDTNLEIISVFKQPYSLPLGGFRQSFSVDANNSFYIGGSNYNDNPRFQALISKHDEIGKTLFRKIVSYSNSMVYGLENDKYGNSLLFGWYHQYNHPNTHIFIEKFNTIGTKIWGFKIEEGSIDGGVKVSDQGEIFVLSNTSSPSDINPDELTDTYLEGPFLAKYSQACAASSCALNIELAEKQDASCGTANGAARIEVIGATESYNIQWNTGANTLAVNNLLPGNYEVSVSDQLACRDTLQVNIASLGGTLPEADFSYELERLDCNSTVANFKDESQNGPSEWRWTFGSDEEFSNSVNPSHIFDGAGTFEVCVTVQNECGINTVCKSITITPAPQMNIAVETQGASCGFNNGSASININGGTAPFNIQWATSPPQSGEKVENLSPGVYALQIEDALGCIDQYEFTIQDFGESLPEANFNFDIDERTISLTNGSRYADSFRWIFGDGNESTTENPIYTFSQDGIYTVCLIVENNCGLDTICKSLEVLEAVSCGMTASATTQPDSCGKGVGTIAIDTNGENGEVSFAWEHNNSLSGPTADGLLAGFYTVTVTDSRGCKDILSVEIENGIDEPFAGFSYLIEGNTISFFNQSENGNEYFWDFGNGFFSTLENPSVSIFNEPGTYTVSLTVTNECGQAVVQEDIIISPQTSVLDQLQHLGFDIFPIPSKDRLFIKADPIQFQKCNQLKLINVLGKEVLQIPLVDKNPDQVEISMSDLSQGVYILQIFMADNSYSIRVIKE